MFNYNDKAGLTYVIAKLKTIFDSKVSKVEGKGLSTNDYTTEEKNKLNAIEADAQKNVQSDWNEADSSSNAFIKNKPTIPDGVAVDDTLSTTSKNPVQNKVITEALGTKASLNNPTFTGDVNVPTAQEDTNSTIAASTAFVTKAIASAVSGITAFEFVIPESGVLPDIGEAGKIYLITKETTSVQNIYDEYIWVNNSWEFIGSTSVDLSGYVKNTDIVPITTSEIDAMFTVFEE